MIKTVIFDLDGVVIDSEKLWEKCSKIFLSNHGLKFESEPLKNVLMGKTIEEGVNIWKKTIGLKGKTKELAQERRSIMMKLYPKAKYTPGFLSFYKMLKGKYKLGIGTSIERHFLMLIDKKLNLLKLFNKKIYSIEDIGQISKPKPDIFLYVAKKLNSNPIDCVVFEDSPNGVEAAKKAGMKCVAITTTTDPEKLNKSDLIINSFSKLTPKIFNNI